MSLLLNLAAAHPTPAIEVRQPEGSRPVFAADLTRAYAPCTAPNMLSWTGVPACAPPATSPCLFKSAMVSLEGDLQIGGVTLQLNRFLIRNDPAYCATGTYTFRVTSRATSDQDPDQIFCGSAICTLPDRVESTTFEMNSTITGGRAFVPLGVFDAINGNVEILNATVIAPDGLPLAATTNFNTTSTLGVAYAGCTTPDPGHMGCSATPWHPTCDFESGTMNPGISIGFSDLSGASPACLTGTYQLNTGVRATLSDCNAAPGSEPCTLVDQDVTVPLLRSGSLMNAPTGLGLNGTSGVVALELSGPRVIDPTGALFATASVPGVRALSSPNITFAKDKLTVRALFPPETLFGGIDPTEPDGMTFQLTSRDGPLLAVEIPAVRWQLQPPLGERWTYVDPGGVLGGIRKASVRLRRKKGEPIGYEIRLDARGAWPVTAELVGVNLTITVARATTAPSTVSAQRSRICHSRGRKIVCD